MANEPTPTNRNSASQPTAASFRNPNIVRRTYLLQEAAERSDSPLGLIIGSSVLVLAMLCVALAMIGNASRDSELGRVMANATTTTQAIIQVELNQIHTVLDGFIPAWAQLKDGRNHRIIPEMIGFRPGNPIKEILYGYCDEETFYTYVLRRQPPEVRDSDTEGYVYLTGGSPYGCHPPGWTVVNSDSLGGAWALVRIRTYEATLMAPPTPLPTPTPPAF